MSNWIPQDQYDFILSFMPICCVDVVIRWNGLILLVKRKDEPAKGFWYPPGGRVLKGETLQACARRKALEETRIDCNVGPIIHTAETIYSTGPSGIPVHSVNTVFLMSPSWSDFNPMIDYVHHSACQWVGSMDDLGQDMRIDQYVRVCLEKGWAA